ncbi:ABC transporter substrate-binding protein [Acidisoma cellulosilytica]|uniref:ABC transporter substrate-binding protein n=1 Tax=Acidisoma cellulosilyticum TaxID=2802395 RepID=A0A963Z8N5_9PROT|nr:ABC transporter substrate-binding protein [Acidisoma cellulosilyticum]MCB8883902.1 ABC transporter substrate-binding protein [Acidisoma cellulosilyticum]
MTKSLLRNAVYACATLSLMALPALAADPFGTAAPKRQSKGTIIVGSANFPESQLIATIYAKALKSAGVPVETHMNIGSREVYIPALIDGSIDLLPEYSGSMLTYLDKNATASSPTDVATALKAALPKGVSILTPSAAQDADTVTVTQATATKYHLASIADLKPVAGDLVSGGAPEWQTREEGAVGLTRIYGVTFKSFKPLDEAGPLTLSALVNGQVQAADVYSTDPSMAADHLVALSDPKSLFPAQNVVPIIATAKVNPIVIKTLNAVSAALTTDDLIKMNVALGNHESFNEVAKDWLKAHNIK